MKIITAAALAALLLAPTLGVAQSAAAAPGAAEFWTDPQTGCSYARVDVPGHPPAWHLVVNGSVIGLTDARAGCASVLRG